MTRTLQKIMLAMVLTIVTSGVFAQVTTSGILGVVKDNAGSPVEFATVVAVHNPSGSQYATITDNSGNFRLSNMRVGGPYTLTVSTSIRNFLEIGKNSSVSS